MHFLVGLLACGLLFAFAPLAFMRLVAFVIVVIVVIGSVMWLAEDNRLRQLEQMKQNYERTR